MTHAEMKLFVASIVRNTKIDSLITTWLNNAIIEYGSSYIFGHLQAYGSKNTAASTPDVTLDADFHWLRSNPQIPAENRTIYPVDEAQLIINDHDYRTETGEVIRYYLKGSILGLWKVPTGIKTITYPYQKYPLKLSDDSDVCDLPESWHELICQRAISVGATYHRSKDLKDDSDRRIRELLIMNRASLFKRPDFPLIQGDYRTGSRRGRKPGRPTFPDHIG